MKPLKLDYEPCLRCMEVSGDGKLQAKRCRHRADCLAHHEGGKPECEQGCSGICNYFSHLKTCQCKEFSNPSITTTKIGIAIHVEFPDGTMVDCDINVPTIPTNSSYDGGVDEVKEGLSKVRPVGWLEESGKQEDLRSAYVEQYKGHVKMRRVNRGCVLPRQVVMI